MKRLVVVLALLALGVGVALFWVGRRSGPPPSRFPFPAEPISYEYLRPYGADSIQPVIDAYERAHPNVRITVREVPAAEYDQFLQAELAQNKKPALFAIKNDRFPAARTLTAPIPDTVLTEKEYRTLFLTEASDQLIIEGRSHGLPLALDAFALYYNKDLLAQAKVEPPKTWNEVVAAVPKLVKKEGTRLTVGGIALGTSTNVERSPDLLALLMRQNGATLISADGRRALFAEPETSSYYPGTEALKFYVSFANPQKATYGFNSAFSRSSRAFANGEVALLIAPASKLAELQEGKARFGTAPLPQVEGAEPVNISSFYAETVSADAPHPEVAWDFLKFLTARTNAAAFLKQYPAPSALKALHATDLKDPLLSPFAQGVEIATPLKKGSERTFDLVMREMIDRALKGENAQLVIDQGAQKLSKALTASSP